MKAAVYASSTCLTMCVFSVCRQMLKEFHDLMTQDRSPLGNTRPTVVLEPGMQRHLSHFSLLTHGFGTPAVLAISNLLQTYFNEMLKVMDKSFSAPSQAVNGGAGAGSNQSNGLDSKVKADKDDNRRE